jgi:hypothetical protein
MRLSRAFQIGDRAVGLFLLLTERKKGDWMPRAWVPMVRLTLAYGAWSLLDLALYVMN